jgi:hypothetical protein
MPKMVNRVLRKISGRFVKKMKRNPQTVRAAELPDDEDIEFVNA